jgi:hypothetical protein
VVISINHARKRRNTVPLRFFKFKEDANMALGDSNQNQNKTYATSYWSRWSIKQKDGRLRLSPRFSSGLLTLEVSKQGGDYKWEVIASITLSPMKASIFASELNKFLNEFTEGFSGKAYGVDTGIKEVRPIIAATMIDDKPTIVIGKVTPDGKFDSRVDYTLNTDYHYALEWTDLDAMEVDKSYYNTMELEQLIDLCLEFSRNAFGAGAAATCDMMRWDYSIPKTLDGIAAKLGVETGKMSNNSRGVGNSFFNRDDNKNDGSTKRSTIEELESELG